MTHADNTQTGPAFWEERYASRALTWSGKVNDLLPPELDGLAPGRALDLGCGTGGDAIWLAEHGWHVTAVDIAHAALEQALAHATAAGVADRIAFARHDVEESFPAGQFDLVSACYLQSPVAFQRLAALRAAADAVGPSGHLVIVSHESTPSGGSHHPPTYMPTAPELLDDLARTAGEWETMRADSVPRTREIDGQTIDYRDNVLHLRRR